MARGLARGAGSKNNVASPTFTLNRVYRAKNFSIYHYDFYRLHDPGILADQLAESVNDNNAVVLVEWADIVEDVLPSDRLSIELKPVLSGADERQITISYTEKNRGIIARLEALWQVSQP